MNAPSSWIFEARFVFTKIVNVLISFVIVLWDCSEYLQEYDELTRRRLYSMSPEEQAHFWRNVQCIIEKDVVRTDRCNPYFAGDDNPNIESMKNILLNYAYYNAGIS